jgi:DNA (cytosine-5)-methyltransferase 1
MNYYNEWEPFAGEWLKELIKDGLIPDGTVDNRSIADVEPSDLKGFTQCHFFAGIGGWSRALELARWSPERPVWTGSPPCQPFSAAGNHSGKDDDRHLWPVFFNLISKCRPPTIFGEQVAAAIRFGWLDDLQTDFEKEGYAAGAFVLPSGSIGAPHKRDRLFFVAYSKSGGRRQEQSDARRSGTGVGSQKHETGGLESGNTIGRSSVADSSSNGQQRQREVGRPIGSEESSDREVDRAINDGRLGSSVSSCSEKPLGDTEHDGSYEASVTRGIIKEKNKTKRNRHEVSEQLAGAGRSEISGDICFWQDSTVIYCRDGKYRPIPTEPALFPLANGISNRVGILRGTGNAIVPQAAAEIIKAYMETYTKLE